MFKELNDYRKEIGTKQFCKEIAGVVIVVLIIGSCWGFTL